jgi:Tol biopolymer transport system component/DNA-binding winged helix-turn-helix (wHTH) protein
VVLRETHNSLMENRLSPVTLLGQEPVILYSPGRTHMEDKERVSLPIHLGIFEVDLRARELRRQGYKVKLQEQPFLVLVMLLERPGEVVTRGELQKKLWPADTFVDFEHGLNRAINKLREALGDDADSPHFIETLPRRGYRLVPPVQTAGIHEVETAGGNRLLLVPPDLSHKVEDAVSPALAPRRQVLTWAAAGVLAVIAVFGYWKPWSTPQIVADPPFSQLDLDVGPDEFSQPAISPDGKRIVFFSKGALAIRRLDQTRTARLAGTEGAFLPFFSPNGQWVAFFAARKLQKIAIDGGVPIALCDAAEPGGGSWGDDDSIVAALDGSRGLSRVPVAGGMPQPLTDSKSDPSSGLMHVWPQVLPGGKRVLFGAINASMQGSLRVLTLNDGKVKTVVENSTHGRYLASGYVVYYQRETLFAAPMDPDRLELTGPAVPLVYTVSNSGGRADFDLSTSGTLLYRRGTAQNSLPSWLYSSGKIEPVLAKPGNYSSPRLSPDGTRLALSVIQEGKQSLWVYDLKRETWNRLTSEDEPEWLPTWTPDGEFLAFRSGNTLAWTRSDGSGKVERLAGVSRNAGPWSFSTDGKWLAFWPLEPDSDLWIVPVERTPGMLRLGQPQPLLQQAGSKGAPAVSPDGRWLAYSSAASGHFEVYVMPFSPQGKASGGKWQVSNLGGWSPDWSRNSRELFYGGLDGRVQVVAYKVSGDSFVAEKPRFWSEKVTTGNGFDVAPDGKRVLALLPADEAKPETILHLLLNLDSELRRRAPVHRN